MILEEALTCFAFSVVVFFIWQYWHCCKFNNSKHSELSEKHEVSAIAFKASDWLLLCMGVCIVILLSMTISRMGDGSSDYIFLNAIVFQLLVISGIAVFKKFTIDFSFGFKVNNEIVLKSFKFFVVGFFVVMACSLCVRIVLYLITQTEPPQQEVIKLFKKTENPLFIAIAIFSFVVLAPISEELFFRGILYRGLKSSLPYLSGYISAFLFAIVHGNVGAFVPLFAFALILSTLYERTGSIIAPMICHGAFNLLNVYFIVLWEYLIRIE